MVFTWKKVRGLSLFLFALSIVIGVILHPTPAISEKLAQASNPKPAIVLVHGTNADATSWQKVIIDREKFHEVFAQDVSTAEAKVLAATQKPPSKTIFDQSVDRAAWKTIPSWYLVGREDRAINPELERFMAKRIGARTTELKASHVSYISHPKEVAKLIEAAATATVKKS